MMGLLQRTLIYIPTREASISPQDAGLPTGRVHTVTLTTEDNLQLHGWHVLPDGQAVEHRPSPPASRGVKPPGLQGEGDGVGALQSARWVVLFFCGNGGNRSYRGPEFEAFMELGAHVFVFDYRGYGENAGSPSEEGLAADARAVWKYVTEERNVSPERVIVYGESLGGGVAVRLAAELCESGTPPAGLIVRSTFSSLADTGAFHYPWLPVRWLLRDRFESVQRIGAVRCPLLQLHGERDEIVPIHLGRKLFAAAPDQSESGVPKRFVTLPTAGHNDVLFAAGRQFREAIATFFQTLDVDGA